MHIPLLRTITFSTLNNDVVRALCIFFFVFMVPAPAVPAYPEGALYWATENYPDNTFLYDSGETYTGAVAALDYACQQYHGSGGGTYTGEVNIDGSANNYPAQKGG